MKKGWNIWVIIVILFWFGLGIFGVYHAMAINEINSDSVLAIVSFGVGICIILNEARLKGLENKMDGLIKALENKIDGLGKALENKIDGLGNKIDGINQRMNDHLSKHV